MQEIWRSIKDYEGLYEVSNLGRVRSVDKLVKSCYGTKQYKPGKIMKIKKNIRNDYLYVNISKDGKQKNCRVHRLVAIAFPDMVSWTEDAKGRPFDELQINHKDNTPANNIVTNLEWCTAKYNNNYKDHNEKSAKSRSRTVYQYTLDDQLVHVWPSVNECGRNGYNIAHISRCCNNKQSYHKGFKWSYILL